MLKYGSKIHANGKSGYTLLHTIAQSSFHLEDIANDLLIGGCNVNTQDVWGRTPLHYTPTVGHARLFLAYGAYVNTKCENGQTPLHCTLMEKQPKLVEVLFENGANPTITDNDSVAPFHLCGQQDSLDIIFCVVLKTVQTVKLVPQ